MLFRLLLPVIGLSVHVLALTVSDLDSSTTSSMLSLMKLALLLTPMSAHHLTLAAQVGASDIVGTFPSTDLDTLKQQCALAEEHGLNISVI